MGLLDDAIREHLELKRRRGSDPTEVDRLEQEALGPVRRAPDDAPELGMDEEMGAGGIYPGDEEAPYPLEEELPEWTDSGHEPAPFDSAAGPSADDGIEEDWSEPATTIQPPAREPEPERGYEPPRHHEIAEEWEAHDREIAGEPAGLEPDEPGPAPPAPHYPPPPHEPPPHEPLDVDQETAEYRVEEEEPEPGAAEGEDVLEETPDFLQDTPDHDRLWFEQRPPRDFDFDG